MSSVDKSQGGDVEAQIVALRADAGARNDAELASLLGIDRSAVTQWRRRGRIPKSAILGAADLRRQRECVFTAVLDRLGADELLYAKALAALFVARYSTSLRGRDEVVDPTRLRAWMVDFDGLTTAAAVLLAETKTGNSAWERFSKQVNDRFFIQNLLELRMSGLGHLAGPRQSPQSESSISAPDQKNEENQ